MVVYEILTSLVFFLIAFYKINKDKDIDILDVPSICCFLFAAYVIAVFFITDVGTIFDWLSNGADFDAQKFSLNPFSRHIYPLGYFANVLMFVPFGFLAPVIECRDIGIVRAVAEGFLFSLLIELSQLLNARYTDVDDLIMNTAGAILGYVIYKFTLSKRFHIVEKPKFEAFIYLLAMFAGHFFLFNEAL